MRLGHPVKGMQGFRLLILQGSCDRNQLAALLERPAAELRPRSIERQRKRLVHPLSNVRRWRAATAHGNAKCPQDLKREAAAAWRRFVVCAQSLPPDQAQPLWQAAAEVAAMLMAKGKQTRSRLLARPLLASGVPNEPVLRALPVAQKRLFELGRKHALKIRRIGHVQKSQFGFIAEYVHYLNRPPGSSEYRSPFPVCPGLTLNMYSS
jgi:hypothetical protein